MIRVIQDGFSEKSGMLTLCVQFWFSAFLHRSKILLSLVFGLLFARCRFRVMTLHCVGLLINLVRLSRFMLRGLSSCWRSHGVYLSGESRSDLSDCIQQLQSPSPVFVGLASVLSY